MHLPWPIYKKNGQHNNTFGIAYPFSMKGLGLNSLVDIPLFECYFKDTSAGYFSHRVHLGSFWRLELDEIWMRLSAMPEFEVQSRTRPGRQGHCMSLRWWPNISGICLSWRPVIDLGRLAFEWHPSWIIGAIAGSAWRTNTKGVSKYTKSIELRCKWRVFWWDKWRICQLGMFDYRTVNRVMLGHACRSFLYFAIATNGIWAFQARTNPVMPS